MHNQNQLLYGVMVAELKDVVPRRHPSLPNLYVCVTQLDFDEKFKLLNSGQSSSWLKNNLTILRTDLSHEANMQDHDEAKKMKRALTTSLKSQGYTVNRNTDIWTVYVVELDPTATSQPGAGYVYVGETVKTPEERFLEHKNRARNSKIKLFAPVVADHGKGLRMDLAPEIKYFDKISSKQAEAEWASHLRSLGYVVEGGH